MDIKDIIFDIILDNCEDLDYEDLAEEKKLMEDLTISSLTFFSMISDLEDEFGMKINEQDLKQLITVGNIISYIQEKSHE